MRHAGMTQGFLHDLGRRFLNKMRLITSTNLSGLFYPACCEGTGLLFLFSFSFFFLNFSLPCFIHSHHDYFYWVFFFFYICTNTHLFYLMGWLFLVLSGGFVETFGEPVVCVCGRECVCVFLHNFGQRRGPVMVHGVCSHVLCVTLFLSLFFFLSSVHLIDVSQVLPIAMSAFISLLTRQML